MPADHACRTITGAKEMKWNEINVMSMEKWWNKISGMRRREKLRENPTQTRFVHQETDMEWPRNDLETPAIEGI